MKCNEEFCKEKAVKKIVHVGSQEVFYCLKHLYKYCAIMEAMGCDQPIVYEIDAK